MADHVLKKRDILLIRRDRAVLRPDLALWQTMFYKRDISLIRRNRAVLRLDSALLQTMFNLYVLYVSL